MKFSLLLPFLSATVLAAPTNIDVAVAPIAHVPAVVPGHVEPVTNIVERALSLWKKDVLEPASELVGLEKRLNRVPPMFMVTDEHYGRARIYYEADIQRAINEGLARYNNNNPTPVWGRRSTQYPHQYRDHEIRVRNLPNVGQADTSYMLEYPIFHDRGHGPHTYTGGNPRRDRVLFDWQGNFITVIAHAEDPNRNDFYPGHEVEYDANGNIQLVADPNRHAGNNPDYANYWGLAIGLALHIQNYKRPGT